MTTIRTSTPIRILAVAMTLMGWLVLSNHCALGSMVTRSKAPEAHGCCHQGGSQPAQEPAGSSRVECCTSLHAVVPADGMPAMAPIVVLLDGWSTLRLLELIEFEIADVGRFDSGAPPRAALFSELVLHRSLRSHAPPFLA